MFIGTVLEVTEEWYPGDCWSVRWVKKRLGWPVRSEYTLHAVEFEVSEWIKGNRGAPFVIRTDSTGASCGVMFGEDGEYLVYAYGTTGRGSRRCAPE